MSLLYIPEHSEINNSESQKIIPSHLLIEFQRGLFHIFPNRAGIPQEEIFSRMQTTKGNAWAVNKGIRLKSIPQKDGSRFKAIDATKLRGIDLLLKIQEENLVKPGQLWIEAKNDPIVSSIISAQNTEELTQILSTQENNSWIFLAYHTHSFLSGDRLLPVIVFPQKRTFVQISHIWKDKTPEDLFGVLVKNKSELDLLFKEQAFMVSPILISYLSHIRLCKACGCVSDLNKVRRNPWLSKAKIL